MKIIYFSFPWMVLILWGCGGKNYLPPDTRKGGDGWLDYIDPPLYTSEDCKDLDPPIGSPEAAVVKFLCSRVRGDNVYLQATLPENFWDGKARRNLDEWKDWKVNQFQLRKKKYADDNEIYIEVFLSIYFKGQTDEGVDEFVVVKKDNKWLVMYPPT